MQTKITTKTGNAKTVITSNSHKVSVRSTNFSDSNSGSALYIFISGTPAIGNILTVILPNGWSASSYQWFRDGVLIPYEDNKTYTIKVEDQGKTINCNVIGPHYSTNGFTIPVTDDILPAGKYILEGLSYITSDNGIFLTY